jgi:hypothetical protein
MSITFNLEVTVLCGENNRSIDMRKLKVAISSLCLIALLTFAVPTVALAEEGPQGGTNSTPSAPPPPPPSSGTLGKLVAAIMNLIG